MIDTTTQKPLQVWADSGAMPYMIVPVEQLDRVTALLDANKISYWVDEEALSTDGGPEVIFINIEGGMSQVDTLDAKEGSWTPDYFDIRACGNG